MISNRWFVRPAATGLVLLLLGCGGSKPTLPEPVIDPTIPSEAPLIRVGLLTGVDEVLVGSEDAFALLDERGVIVVGSGGETFGVRRENGQILVYTPAGELVDSAESQLRVEPRRRPGVVTVNGARYPQSLLVLPSPSHGLNVVNVVDVETYLRGVVPLEIGHQDPKYLEAAKSQAVAARTYVASHLDQYPEEGFDLYSGVLDQVYGSMDRWHPNADRAVLETRGVILMHQGRPIRANYASTCGGTTASVQESFNSAPVAYLKTHDDVVEGRVSCRTSKYFRWEQTWSGPELLSTLARTVPQVLGQAWEANAVRNVRVATQGASGRVVDLVIETDRGDYAVSRGAIRRVLETPQGTPLWSTSFDLEVWRKGDVVDVIRTTGRGWGHGVGMCQWGAMQLSSEGKSYRLILGHYYPGTRLHAWYRARPVSARAPQGEDLGRG